MRSINGRWESTVLAVVVAVSGALAPGTAVQGQPQPIPLGWHAVMPSPGEFSVRGDVARRSAGKGWMAGTIASAVAAPEHYALMQQSIRADLYRGQRIRLTGFLKSAGAAGSTGLFVRVDGENATQTSDYMAGRLLREASDWTLRSVVVDVPKDAVGITFGFHFSGVGQAWLDDVRLDVVGDEVAVTGVPGHQVLSGANGFVVPQAGSNGRSEHDSPMVVVWRRAYARAALRPVNLDFEEMARIAAR